MHRLANYGCRRQVCYRVPWYAADETPYILGLPIVSDELAKLHVSASTASPTRLD